MKKILVSLIAFIVVFMNLGEIHAINRGSVTITYHDATYGYIDDIETQIYKIADERNQKMTLLDEYKNCSIDLNTNNQKETLTKQVNDCLAYIHQNHLQPILNQYSKQGTVQFNELDRGVYIIDARYSKNDYQVTIEPMLVSIPSIKDHKEYINDLSLKPKFMMSPIEKNLDYTVLKVWKDHNDEKHLRPAYIKVGLYKDNQLQKTVTLDALSNWSYTFEGLDSGEHWQVKELDIDSNYQSHITYNNKQFIIENTLKEKHSITTGDNVTLTFYLILVCVSSILFFSLIKKIRSGNSE